MVVMQFVLGRDTRTPISVSIQEDDAAVAIQQFEQIFNGYVRVADPREDDEEVEVEVDDDDDDEGGSGPGFGPGSFNIN